MRKNVKLTPSETLWRLLAAQPALSAGELARAAGITRQAAHYHLRREALSGRLAVMGKGRATTYVPTAPTVEIDLRGADEDLVWRNSIVPILAESSPTAEALSIERYAFTEMLNNCIDHSGSERAMARMDVRAPSIRAEVLDRGIGVFESVRTKFGLADAFQALEQIIKGKTTTDPERHTGQGIFFTSRAVDVFTVEANGIRWTVDNMIDDMAVGEIPETEGSRVVWELDRATGRNLRDVFKPFEDEQTFAFSRTEVRVALFGHGSRFVSRSEAKRLSMDLERFEHVVLDFEGVQEVGQGFVDELFRVWKRDHPATRLESVNMNRAIERMITRGLADAARD